MKSKAFRRKGGRGRGDRGAVLVEFAITAPILFMLLFAIIDFGSSYNDYINVRQGARDGIRETVVNTNEAVSGAGHCGALKDAAFVACYTKDRVGLTADNTAVKVTFCAVGESHSGCPSGTQPGFKSSYPVKICVQYKTGSVTGFFGPLLNNKTLKTEVESLIETDEPSFTSSYADTAIDKHGWDASCNSL
jgi:Flp pilus assembly protein TadG